MSAPQVLAGDSLELMAALAPGSVDAVVTDPPYGIRFMGKAWDGADIERRAATIQSKRPRPDGRAGDYSLAQAAGEYDRSPEANRTFQAWSAEWAAAALRVAKPGGWLVVFGGTRTFHRLGCAVEDAGWEIRDCFGWLHGQGFPKSLDVAKAIDRAAGAEPQPLTVTERDLLGEREQAVQRGEPCGGLGLNVYGDWAEQRTNPLLLPATAEAARWRGWGTGLKPAWEPILLARKPLEGTVAENVLRHGTGALNVDGCRIPGPQGDGVWGTSNAGSRPGFNASPGQAEFRSERHAAGRWPANVLLDEAAAAELDAQAGLAGGGFGTSGGDPDGRGIYGAGFPHGDGRRVGFGDVGGPSRFFYCPKAGRAEREEGLEGFGARPGVRYGQALVNGSGGLINGTGERSPTRNPHPTVKPVALMRWLVRLVTMPGGLVLDPFCGSGSTGVACVLEGLGFLGMEREADYVDIAVARIGRAREQPSLWEVLEGDPAQRALWEDE